MKRNHRKAEVPKKLWNAWRSQSRNLGKMCLRTDTVVLELAEVFYENFGTTEYIKTWYYLELCRVIEYIFLKKWKQQLVGRFFQVCLHLQAPALEVHWSLISYITREKPMKNLIFHSTQHGNRNVSNYLNKKSGVNFFYKIPKLMLSIRLYASVQPKDLQEGDRCLFFFLQ